jgi:hypothetical protein
MVGIGETNEEVGTMLRIRMAIFSLVAVAVLGSSAVAASQTGWMGVIVARGELKEEIKSTPILERPNRPLHFYGNTVRREYYRGKAQPARRDAAKAGAPVVVKQ